MPNPARCPVLPDRSRLARRARGFRVRLKSGTTTQTLPSRSTSSPPPRPLPLLLGPLSPPRSPSCLSRTALTAFLNSLHSATSLLESAIERSHFYGAPWGWNFPIWKYRPNKIRSTKKPCEPQDLTAKIDASEGGRQSWTRYPARPNGADGLSLTRDGRSDRKRRPATSRTRAREHCITALLRFELVRPSGIR